MVFGGNTVKDLNEINNNDRAKFRGDLETNESLNDFRSRLNLRRKIKTRELFAYQDDDRTDNSCDSTTTKAHEDILRSANLLKQGQTSEITSRLVRSEHGTQERKDDFTGKDFHKEVQCTLFNKRFVKPDVDLCSRNCTQDESIL